MGNENSGGLPDELIAIDVVNRLKALFDRLDINGDGIVEKSEIEEKFLHSPEEREKVSKLFN